MKPLVNYGNELLDKVSYEISAFLNDSDGVFTIADLDTHIKFINQDIIELKQENGDKDEIKDLIYKNIALGYLRNKEKEQL